MDRPKNASRKPSLLASQLRNVSTAFHEVMSSRKIFNLDGVRKVGGEEGIKGPAEAGHYSFLVGQ